MPRLTLTERSTPEVLDYIEAIDESAKAKAFRFDAVWRRYGPPVVEG